MKQMNVGVTVSGNTAYVTTCLPGIGTMEKKTTQVDLREYLTKTDCPDCGVAPETLHLPGCDVARCTDCGMQFLRGDCETGQPAAWTGIWPGVSEAIEFGWFTTPDFSGGVVPDLNRLYTGEPTWSTEKQRWVRRDA